MRRTLMVVATVTLSLTVWGAGTPVMASADGAGTHGVTRGAANGLIAFDRPDPASPDGDTFVFTIHPDGSGEHQLLPTHTCCPGWSPDGRRLAVPRALSDGRIGTATVNADGTGYRPLPLTDPTLNIGCGTGAWAPKDQVLTCESWDDSTTGRNGLYTISAITGHIIRPVTHAPGTDHDIPGSYSPNGKQIVFERFDADGASVGMFIVRTDGTHLRQLPQAGDRLNIGVDWSTHGNELLYSRHITGDVRGSLWLIHADGTAARQLVIDGIACGGRFDDPNGIGCHAPRWSPDDTHIVFIAAGDVFTAEASGHHSTQVTQDGGDDADWAPAQQ